MCQGKGVIYGLWGTAGAYYFLFDLHRSFSKKTEILKKKKSYNISVLYKSWLIIYRTFGNFFQIRKILFYT